jgi:hypothetical protein
MTIWRYSGMAMETVVASSERQSRGQFDTRPGILALPSLQRSLVVSTGGDGTTFVSSCLGFALFLFLFLVWEMRGLLFLLSSDPSEWC